MARTLLNSMSTVEIVLLGVGGMVALTIAGVLLARRLFPRLADSEFEPVADSLRVVYELIFALILAFVIAAVLDEMSNAESAVASEATTIGELVRANDALPARDRLRLDNSVEQYVRAVATDEWQTMKDGKPSARATSALEGMYAEYRRVEPRGTAQTENYSQALDNLHDIASQRRERLNIAAGTCRRCCACSSSSGCCCCSSSSTGRSCRSPRGSSSWERLPSWSRRRSCSR